MVKSNDNWNLFKIWNFHIVAVLNLISDFVTTGNYCSMKLEVVMER